MSYDVKIVAKSIGPNRIPIGTFQLRYPRMVHAELMTHRVFSRNASSTRAIPTAKMIEWIEKDPAMPVYWGKNQKGMQATEELSEFAVEQCKQKWLAARDDAIFWARALMNRGVHKQIASRILEPWAHINVVVTSTDFNNFFALRCHKDAMPEIQVLAVEMARLWHDTPAEVVGEGVWHLPYVTKDEIETFSDDVLVKLSTARCGRVSYKTLEDQLPAREADIARHDQFIANGHWSPPEHPAQAQPEGVVKRSGNFLGWTQYRQTLPKSVHATFDFAKLDEFGERGFIV